MNQFKEISKLFNIKKIEEESIEIYLDNKIKKIVIYEIEPITIFELTDEIVNNILTTYTEFLRELDIDMQILIKSKKFEVEEYIENFKKNIDVKNEIKMELYLNYINNLSEKLKSEKMYFLKYYIVIDIKQVSVENVDNLMLKFKKIGCNVIKINKEKLVKLLYQSINKS